MGNKIDEFDGWKLLSCNVCNFSYGKSMRKQQTNARGKRNKEVIVSIGRGLIPISLLPKRLKRWQGEQIQIQGKKRRRNQKRLRQLKEI